MPPKYIRRLISVPVVVLLTAVFIVLIPIWLPLTALADVIRNPRRMRFTRLGAVLVLLGLNEIRSLLLILLLWLRCGTRVSTPKNQRIMQRVLRTYAIGLVDCTRRALGVRIATTGLDEALAAGGPLLVLGHHTSLLDSAVPVDQLGPRGVNLRYVIKETLAYAPAFDIGGHMLPIHFVNRTGQRTGEEMAAISRLAGGMDETEAFVLFPEGNFYNPARLERGVERLRKDAPHLVERAMKLRHTLPPRAGGALALLGGNPTADIVIMAHAGLESFSSIGKIVRNVPLRKPVHVHFWRVPRSEVPTEPGEQYDWLFEQFERVDAFASGELDVRSA